MVKAVVTLTVIPFRVPADLKAPVYHYGVLTGGEKEWDFAYSQFTSTNVVSDKRLLLHAMAGAQQPWLIERFFTSFIKSPHQTWAIPSSSSAHQYAFGM